MKDSFVFFGSFLRVVDGIPDAAMRDKFLRAIVEYGLTGEHTELGWPYDVFLVQIAASIDAARNHWEESVANGKRGARRRGTRTAARRTERRRRALKQLKTTPNNLKQPQTTLYNRYKGG